MTRTRAKHWTRGQPQIATDEDLAGNWNGRRDGTYFRCYMCGYHFKLGDRWRFVPAGQIRFINFLVCGSCDGPDVLQRWKDQQEEAERRFWWLRKGA